MPRCRMRLPGTEAGVLAEEFVAVREQLGVPGHFSPELESAAVHAAQHASLPELDRTDIELVTIDPPGSMDLDQALHIARDGSGYRVTYAIADVAAFVTPGDPLDVEANERGETLYGPDSRSLLYPATLSEGAASLLPGQDRPALLWTIRIDSSGESQSSEVVRARVRSRARLDYDGVQADLDAGRAAGSVALLAEVGRLRLRRERERGGVDLRLPEQEVVRVPGVDRLALEFRSPRPVEGYNAQISLLTGIGAAQLMMYAEVGILRTLPPAEGTALARLHRVAAAMDVVWPAEMTYPDFIHTLDPGKPAHAAVLMAATGVLRGAGYTAFDGAVPEQPLHSAIASEYAHVTAPLRRLVDRYAGEVCVALCAGVDVPDHVRERLSAVAGAMVGADHRAHAYEHACIDLVEAAVLAPDVGATFGGVIIEVDHDNHHDHHDDGHRQDRMRPRGLVQLTRPAVTARVTGSALPLGERVRVRLTTADVRRRVVEFELD